MYARTSPSRTCRLRGLRGSSPSLLYQTDENVFQRALFRVDILEFYAHSVEVGEQSGYVCALSLRVVCVDQFATICRKFQFIVSKVARDPVELAMQLQRQLLLAE